MIHCAIVGITISLLSRRLVNYMAILGLSPLVIRAAYSYGDNRIGGILPTRGAEDSA